MKLNFGCIAALATASLCAAPVYASTCAPQTLVHIVTVDVTPGVAAASFAAQPKSTYRLGSDRMRIEESPDTVNGITGLVVIAEPNIWLVNLYDHTGRHAVDPGPTFFAKAPLFGTTDIAPKLAALELGCEAEFIAANGLRPARVEQLDKSAFDVYRLAEELDAVEILERPAENTPAFARLYREGKLVAALRYDVYARGLPDDKSLFVPPPGVRFTEVSSSR